MDKKLTKVSTEKLIHSRNWFFIKTIFDNAMQ
jgi:hypothetical protein